VTGKIDTSTINESDVNQSQVLKRLFNYDLMPDTKLRQKLDFYFLPYCKKYNMNKFMTFGDVK
jgi:hypothetical protein